MNPQKKQFLFFILFLFIISGITFYLGIQISKRAEHVIKEKLNKKLEEMQFERDSLLAEYNSDLKAFNISVIKLRQEVIKNNKIKEEYLEKANKEPPEKMEDLEIAIYDLLNKIRN
jgi:hypothetical protein